MAENVLITPGTGDTVAAEDVGTVKYQRVKLIDATLTSTASTGVAANPFQVSLANHGANAVPITITGSTTIVGTVTVTGITTVIGAISAVTTITNPVTITGSTSVLSMPAITGSVSVISMPNVTVTSIPAITGSVSVLSIPNITVSTIPAITGSVTLVGVSTITGSTTIIGMPAVTGSVALVGTSTVTRALQSGKFSSNITTTDCTTAVTVVAAVASQYAYISSYLISALAAGQYWLEDGSGTALTCRHFLAANGGASYTTVDGMPISTAISNTTIKVKSTVAGSTGCLVVGYNAAG